jgi:hypothetical protein
MSAKDYCEAVAQIIPIVFLTMAVGEARVLCRRPVFLALLVRATRTA